MARGYWRTLVSQDSLVTELMGGWGVEDYSLDRGLWSGSWKKVGVVGIYADVLRQG